MRVMVLGSEGTLGRPLSAALEGRGHEVCGVDLQHAAPRHAYHRADVARYRELEEALHEFEPDLVYNLAAEFGRVNGDRWHERCWRTNCVGVANILRLQEALRFRLVHASSSEVYGELGDEWYSEDATDLKPANDYAISKLANEMQIANHVARDRGECMTLRFFNAYGPGEHYHPFRSVVCLFAQGALSGDGYAVFRGYKRVFMHVDDFIPTLANCVERFRHGLTVNIGGTEYRGIEELDEIIRAATGLQRDAVTYLDTDEHNVRSKRPNISRAKELLGHDPQVTLEEGVPQYVEWLRGVMR